MKTSRSGSVELVKLQGPGKHRRPLWWFVSPALMAVTMALFVTLPANAAPETSTGGDVGWFYAITHLHPAAYLILFLIFVLSVVNLVFQGWISGAIWPLRWVTGLIGTGPLVSSGVYPPKRTKRPHPDTSYQGYSESVSAGLVGLPRSCTAEQVSSQAGTPTPLDGVNHALPRIVGQPGAQIGAPRIVERQAEKKTNLQDFKFSAAVDVPSPLELERREKEQLVVSGSVQGLDDKGIPAVIVYLTDAQGNRVGQSCRSLTDTGEFKVLVNEPGRYFLNAYKRGHVPEDSEPMALPRESGKVEGYHVRMIPEGCIVQGRVMYDSGAALIPDLRVKCLSRNGDLSRVSRVDSEGRFRISGIPVNSECYLEVVRSDGKQLSQSAPFQTVQKREIYQELTIRSKNDQVSASGDVTGQTRTFEEKKEPEKKERASTSVPAAP